MTTAERLIQLEHANEIRFGRAAAKRRLRTEGLHALPAVLVDSSCAGMPVGKLLLHLPYWGPARVRRALRPIRLKDRTVGSLSPGERGWLIVRARLQVNQLEASRAYRAQRLRRLAGAMERIAA